MRNLRIGICCSTMLVIFCLVVMTVAAQSWKVTVYGEDWEAEEEAYTQAIPELATHNAIPATASDTALAHQLSPERLAELNEAIAACYQRLDMVTTGYANTKTCIYACRELPDYFLLWIEESEVYDGGRSLIYSKTKKRIVGEFSDGGIRG